MWHRSLLTALLLTAVASEALGLDVYIVTGQSNGYRLSSLSTEPKAKADAHKVYYSGIGKCGIAAGRQVNCLTTGQ